MRRLINLRPGKGSALVLGALPFIALLMIYLVASDQRLSENPSDKMLPAFSRFADAIQQYATEPDQRSGKVLLWLDTQASLTRLGMSLLLGAALGLVFGVATGALPFVRAGFAPLIATLSLIPPLAILPILFIVFGMGEVSKVALILFGIAPFLMRDLAMRVAEIPSEQIIKAQTLGASSWTVIVRVILPQLLPRLLDSLRLSLGAAWLFLIASEAIAADEGLGYRIFLVRRYMAMDVILPYVAWITLLAFMIDWLFRQASQRLFPWYSSGKNT